MNMMWQSRTVWGGMSVMARVVAALRLHQTKAKQNFHCKLKETSKKIDVDESVGEMEILSTLFHLKNFHSNVKNFSLERKGYLNNKRKRDRMYLELMLVTNCMINEV
jgi:hypothetical protein